MNCYLCDSNGRTRPAVAVCHTCGAGLCREHLDRDLLARRPHGLHRHGCTHRLIQAAEERRQALLAAAK